MFQCVEGRILHGLNVIDRMHTQFWLVQIRLALHLPKRNYSLSGVASVLYWYVVHIVLYCIVLTRRTNCTILYCTDTSYILYCTVLYWHVVHIVLYCIVLTRRTYSGLLCVSASSLSHSWWILRHCVLLYIRPGSFPSTFSPICCHKKLYSLKLFVPN
jgi:hypothetical protein